MSSLNANVMFKPFAKHLLFRKSVISEVGIWHQRSFFAAYRTDPFLQKTMCVARNGPQLSHNVSKVVVTPVTTTQSSSRLSFLSMFTWHQWTISLADAAARCHMKTVASFGCWKNSSVSRCDLGEGGRNEQKHRAFSFSLTRNENQMLFVIGTNFDFRMEDPSGQTWLIYFHTWS